MSQQKIHSGIYEISEKNFIEIALSYENKVRNEATTRYQIIDEWLKKCLGWDVWDVHTEERTVDGGYIDYIVGKPKRLIIEAKKEEIGFEIPVGAERDLIRSIPSLVKKNPELEKAMIQALGYCSLSGVPFAGVTNGHQIVVFIASRNDSIPPMEGKAIVFSSLERVVENFPYFWNALSKVAISKNNLYSILTSEEEVILPPKLSSKILEYRDKKEKSEFQKELQISADLTFETLMDDREIETEFLKECYCQSGELSKYALLSKEMLEARYSYISDTSKTELSLIKSGFDTKAIRDITSKKPIIIIGDVNTGKSSFIRHLIKIDAEEQLSKSINLYIDLQVKGNLETDLRDFVLKEIKEQLDKIYNIDIGERNFVRGLYREDLKKFGQSVVSDLKKSNKEKFIEEEVKFLNKIQEDKKNHLKLSLKFLTEHKKHSIVIFLDNADQRDDNDQMQVFLIAQELADNWQVIVFVTLRPETFLKAKKDRVFVGHYPKVFPIQPPSIHDVIKKRLNFALKISSGHVKLKGLDKDIKVTLTKISSLIKCLIHTLEKSKDISECIENTSNGDVRFALDLLREIFSTPQINQEKLLALLTEKLVPIRYHEFLKFMILKDNLFYIPEDSNVYNILEISTADPKEYFLVPILLEYLTNLKETKDGYIANNRVFQYLQTLGYYPAQIEDAILRCDLNRLIKVVAKDYSSFENLEQLLQITPMGKYLLKKLIYTFTYIDLIIPDSVILDEEVRNQLKDTHNFLDALTRAEILCSFLDEQWKLINSKNTQFNWLDCSASIKLDISNAREKTLQNNSKNL